MNMPKKQILLFKTALITFIFIFIWRLIFSALYLPELQNVSGISILKSLYLGGKFDLRLTLLLLSPLLLLLGKISWWKWILSPLFFIVELFYVIDFGTFSYLHTRINFFLVKYMQTPLISLKMVWQSYPVIWIIIGMILVLLTYHYLIKKLIVYQPPYMDSLPWKAATPLWILFVLLWAGGIYGKFAWYPLRWSEAFFHTNETLASATVNPVLYFFDTIKFTDDFKVDKKKVQEYYDVVAPFLGVKQLDKENLNFARKIKPTAKIKGTPNVVIIVMESLVAFKCGIFNNKLAATPHLDTLARNGLFFPRFYVPVQSTARSMFALATGLPDISQVKTASRNPLVVNQNSIINYMKNYKKYYFLGGSANWGNIRGIFSHNIDNLEIFEEGSYHFPRVDVWGISDYHLFITANDTFRQKRDRPFFAIIQSSGFHRPYTVPKNHPEFKLKSLDMSLAQIRKLGFLDNKEYDALRWQDYALGNFIRLAKKEKYFKNTIFIIYGDHGLPAEETENVSKGEKAHKFENFHVPLVFYGPNFFSPQRDNRIASQLDLLPSLMSLLGLPYTNTSFGRDLFNTDFNHNRKSFVFYWYARPPDFALIDDKYFYRERLGHSQGLYEYRGADPFSNILEKSDNNQFDHFKTLAQGLYFTAKYLMLNNPRLGM